MENAGALRLPSETPRTYALAWGWLRHASARLKDGIGFGECFCRRIINFAWSRRGGPWLRSSSKVQHVKTAYPLPVSSGRHALRPHANDARAPLAASDRALRRYAARTPRVCCHLWGHLKWGDS